MPQIIVLLIGLVIGAMGAVAVWYAIRLHNRLIRVRRAVDDFVLIMRGMARRIDSQESTLQETRTRVNAMETLMARAAGEDDGDEAVGQMRASPADWVPTPDLEGAVSFWERIGEDD